MDWEKGAAKERNDGETKIAHALRKWHGWVFEVTKVGKEQLIDTYHYLDKQISEIIRPEDKRLKRRKCKKNKRSWVFIRKEGRRR